jgi:hypothetical protein
LVFAAIAAVLRSVGSRPAVAVLRWLTTRRYRAIDRSQRRISPGGEQLIVAAD